MKRQEKRILNPNGVASTIALPCATTPLGLITVSMLVPRVSLRSTLGWIPLPRWGKPNVAHSPAFSIVSTFIVFRHFGSWVPRCASDSPSRNDSVRMHPSPDHESPKLVPNRRAYVAVAPGNAFSRLAAVPRVFRERYRSGRRSAAPLGTWEKRPLESGSSGAR
jgi:hypothetical protein